MYTEPRSTPPSESPRTTVAPSVRPGGPAPEWSVVHDGVIERIHAAGLALRTASDGVDGSAADAVDQALGELDAAVRDLQFVHLGSAARAQRAEEVWRMGLERSFDQFRRPATPGEEPIVEALVTGLDASADGRAPRVHAQPERLWDDLVACGTNVRQMLEVAVRHIVDLLGDGAVATRMGPAGVLGGVACDHVDPEARAFTRKLVIGEVFPLGTGLVGEVAATATPLLVPVVPPDVAKALASAPSLPYFDRYPLKSMVIVPIVAEGRVLGTLGASRMESDVPYDRADLATMQRIAEQVAVAITAAEQHRPVPPEDLYQAVFERNVDAVLVTAPDGRILAANPVACTILRMTEAEICTAGRGALSVADDPRWKVALTERARTGRVRAVLPMRRRGGEVFMADVSSVIFDAADGSKHTYVMFRDVTDELSAREELERSREALKRMALEDDLTGLANRRGFQRAASTALAHADRDGATLQVLYLDVNRFKAINDRYGHDAGDQVLIRVARALRECSRSVDVVARLGGDEFVVLLYGAEPDDAARIVRRTEALLGRDGPAEPAVTLSTGVAGRAAGDPVSIEELVRQADRAMYRNKGTEIESVDLR